MAHTHTRILIHMVFATHERRPLITPELMPKLHPYMAGIARNLDCHVYALGGVADHCHIVFDLPPKLSLAEFANQVKSSSTKWARGDGARDFGWQRGYGAFSMNAESLDRAIRYVETQEQHHAKLSMRQELEEFLRVNGMAADTEFLDGVYRPQG